MPPFLFSLSLLSLFVSLSFFLSRFTHTLLVSLSTSLSLSLSPARSLYLYPSLSRSLSLCKRELFSPLGQGAAQELHLHVVTKEPVVDNPADRRLVHSKSLHGQLRAVKRCGVPDKVHTVVVRAPLGHKGRAPHFQNQLLAVAVWCLWDEEDEAADQKERRRRRGVCVRKRERGRCQRQRANLRRKSETMKDKAEGIKLDTEIDNQNEERESELKELNRKSANGKRHHELSKRN